MSGNIFTSNGAHVGVVERKAPISGSIVPPTSYSPLMAVLKTLPSPLKANDEPRHFRLPCSSELADEAKWRARLMP